jgi:hypothetical protein
MEKETTKTIDPEALTVEAIVTVRASKSDPEKTFSWVLDYSKVDMASLLEKASRSDIIALQARWRSKPFTKTHFNVGEDIVERPRLTEKERVKRAIANAVKKGYTKEEILAMLEDE